MIPVDAAEREAALDARSSVCISAPAGSGKTSLLVQRFLVLLSRVAAPESVVAITFTRKAAAEMRTRVLQALRAAGAGEAGTSDHEQRLLDAARRVLQRDSDSAWGLLVNPARLRIQTIDSFCGELTRQMPVLSGCGGPVRATDDAGALYREAIDAFLRREQRGTDAARRGDLEQVLLHLDNDWQRATELLAGLLIRREQWQRLFGGQGLGADERDLLRETATALVRYRVQRLRRQLAPFIDELQALAAFSAAQLGQAVTFDPRSDEVTRWRSVVDLLLTRQDTWRRSVNKRNGFPSGPEAATQKSSMLALLRALADEGGEPRRLALAELRLLPDTSVEQEHWSVLAALTRLLPRLLAQLLLVFQRHGEVDHAQIALAALEALGDDETPTDLALRLDHRIEHLLVDEFQDTSTLQFELLRRLTRGWATHNAQHESAPRTLLVVGDPMQSIYGFREANVGLFIRARDEGIGDLALQPIDLSVNFRSGAGLVSWNNSRFTGVFPPEDDPQLGAVAFKPAAAARPEVSEPVVRLFTGPGDKEAEITALCDAVAAALGDSSTRSIAILGRSRRSLHPFLAALRVRGIDFAARDFDPLASRPHVRDLVTLVTVLHDRHDRYAWLCLLRSPAIALDHRDLLLVARVAPTPSRLAPDNWPAQLCALSADGCERVAHLVAVLAWADRFRDRLALRVWVEETWLRLGAHGALEGPAAEDDARQFFALLEDLERQQRTPTATALRDALANLYASAGDARCRVQVMTLHKAKGLEFDRVFIPALDAGARKNDADLLLWDEFTLPGSAPAILLDIRGEGGAASSGRLYDFLRAREQRKRMLEATRLLYVGCTRAADHLWLSGCLPWKENDGSHGDPPAGSLLAALWGGLPSDLRVEQAARETSAIAAAPCYRRVMRLPASPRVEPPGPGHGHGEAFPDSRLARSLGTALHRCLESLVYRTSLPFASDEMLRSLLRVALLETGTDLTELARQEASGQASLDRVLADPWLRWALAPQRGDRRAELPLTAATADGQQALVLDYTFHDERTGERWVVDYKTAAPRADESTSAFLAAQTAQYAAQLSAYREALQGVASGPVRCALYFTALAQHCELKD